MARGWESKSIEAQQDAAAKRYGATKGHTLSAEDRERQRRRRVLELARVRAAKDLERAGAPAQRTMLERALADLDRAIEELR
jgi:hypothetical protein